MTEEYLPEEVLIERVQSGEYSWLDYVCHHTKEYRTEFERYCRERFKAPTEEMAKEFVEYEQNLIDEAIAEGNA
jgi:hypothetical protein